MHPWNSSFNGQFFGSKVCGKEEKQLEGSSNTGPSMEVTVGCRKWATLMVGSPSPLGGTISSSLSTIPTSDSDKPSMKKKMSLWVVLCVFLAYRDCVEDQKGASFMPKYGLQTTECGEKTKNFFFFSVYKAEKC